MNRTCWTDWSHIGSGQSCMISPSSQVSQWCVGKKHDTNNNSDLDIGELFYQYLHKGRLKKTAKLWICPNLNLTGINLILFNFYDIFLLPKCRWSGQGAPQTLQSRIRAAGARFFLTFICKHNSFNIIFLYNHYLPCL